jgi:hypothetical protein
MPIVGARRGEFTCQALPGDGLGGTRWGVYQDVTAHGSSSRPSSCLLGAATCFSALTTPRRTGAWSTPTWAGSPGSRLS